MTIYCDTVEELVEVCAGLVERGIQFEATVTGTLRRVVCTGGY